MEPKIEMKRYMFIQIKIKMPNTMEQYKQQQQTANHNRNQIEEAKKNKRNTWKTKPPLTQRDNTHTHSPFDRGWEKNESDAR